MIKLSEQLGLDLTSLAFDKLIKKLKEYGNQPSDEHAVSLYKLLYAYTHMAQGGLTGRWAFPLPTGAGKTLSVVAWIASLYELRIENISVAVCASKVEALCDLKRDLISMGVPEDMIGLLHSYRCDPARIGEPGFASLPFTDHNDQRQFLLCTHERVRGKGGLEKYNLYQGKPRDLLIWDESLFVSDASSIVAKDLKKAIGYLGPELEDRPSEDLKRAFAYLQSAIDTLNSEIASQQDQGQAANQIRLPELTGPQIQEFKRSLGDDEVCKPLKDLLDMSQNPLRVTFAQGKNGVITYDIVVPSDLKNIIILDASYPIRELERMDETIKPYPGLSVPISYENVTIHQLDQPSGRNTMEQAFKPRSRKNRTNSNDICKVVRGIPKDQAVLIFTFKKRYVDFEQILRSDMAAMGIDVDATVQVPVWKDGEQTYEEKPRINFLTWGNETSLSKYSFCSNVIFAGVLHRSHMELAAKITGQRDELMAQLPFRTLKDIEQSECAYSVHQAMCRGSCRIITKGRTKDMRVWLIHRGKQIRERLDDVMPGLKWKTWETDQAKPKGKIERLADRISDYLKQLGSSDQQVPTRKIKEDLGLSKIPPKTFTQAAKKVSPEETGFQHKGRSFERVHQQAA